MKAISDKFRYIESLAKEMKKSAESDRKAHRKTGVNPVYLNAVIAHALEIASDRGLMNAYDLPALSLVPENLSLS